jgi:hypothetical protein
MTKLELSARECEVLRSTLMSYMSDLRMEIADTDRMEYRDVLKARKQTLLDIVEKLPKEDEA